MTYQLYRLSEPGDDLDASTLLGSFEEFDTALAARDEDTVRLFETTGPGEVLHAHHQILGPGLLGPATAHPVSTALERPVPASDRELGEARHWLSQIHRLD